jgi:hypothetical protein
VCPVHWLRSLGAGKNSIYGLRSVSRASKGSRIYFMNPQHHPSELTRNSFLVLLHNFNFNTCGQHTSGGQFQIPPFMFTYTQGHNEPTSVYDSFTRDVWSFVLIYLARKKIYKPVYIHHSNYIYRMSPFRRWCMQIAVISLDELGANSRM